eukprot:g14125.t1
MLEMRLSRGEISFITTDLSFNKAFGTEYEFSLSGEEWIQRNMETNSITSIRRTSPATTSSDMVVWQYRRPGELEWQPFAKEDAEMLELHLSRGEIRFITTDLSFNKAFGTEYEFSFSGPEWSQRNMQTNSITIIRRSPNTSNHKLQAAVGATAEDGKASANSMDLQKAVAATKAFRPGSIECLHSIPWYRQIPWGYLGLAMLLCWLGYVIYTWQDNRETNSDYTARIVSMFEIFGFSLGAVLVWILYLSCILNTATIYTFLWLTIIAKLATLIMATYKTWNEVAGFDTFRSDICKTIFVYWCLWEFFCARVRFKSLYSLSNLKQTIMALVSLRDMFKGKRSDVFKISFLFSLLMLAFCFFAAGFADLESCTTLVFLNAALNLERKTMPVTSEMWLALKWQLLHIAIVSGLIAFDFLATPFYIYTMWVRACSPASQEVWTILTVISC